MRELSPNSWFVLTTKPQHEFIASRMLSESDILSYLPIYQSRSRWSDRTKLLPRPLFPRYLFAQFERPRRAAVLRTPGILSILQFCGLPATVTDSEVEQIREMVRQGAFPGQFIPGCTVRITEGALAGQVGTLVKIDDQMHIQIKVQILGKLVNMPVTTEERYLERVA